MDLALYAVNAVLVEGRSVRDVAAATGRTKSWVHRHVVLFRAGGQAALAPAKRGPKVALNQTPPATEGAIISLRKHLGELGLDAGASTIAYHLRANGLTPPARATIHRILVRRGFVTPQPQKRPRASWQRFEAQLPNECWQSDMTHWHLDHGVHCEIINYIDDYSRAVLASVAVAYRTGRRVPQMCIPTPGIPGIREAGTARPRANNALASYCETSGRTERACACPKSRVPESPQPSVPDRRRWVVMCAGLSAESASCARSRLGTVWCWYDPV
jgi:Winged helix-turn helix